MGRIYRLALLIAALPFVTASATDAGCDVHAHRAVSHKTLARKSVRHSSGVGVAIDEARVVSFPKPVKTVLVGNPYIAEVSMIDARHAFVFGKTFGITNLIALDSDGTQVTSQQLTVLNTGSAVTVNRGAAQFNYMCTSAHCETAPRPGDPKEFVQNTEDPANSHEDLALKNATNIGTTSQVASGQ